MSNIGIGKKLQIQCYKHDGNVHRFWDEAVVLNVERDYIVCGNNKTTVIESDGSVWQTKEPAVMYYFKNKWYNIIAQFKKDGIYYYCNIASPYIIEDNTIKYIDYDLDLRIFSNGKYKILDKMEYLYHKKEMGYSDDLDKVINNAMTKLIHDYKCKMWAFDSKNNQNYLNLYQNLKKIQKGVDK